MRRKNRPRITWVIQDNFFGSLRRDVKSAKMPRRRIRRELFFGVLFLGEMAADVEAVGYCADIKEDAAEAEAFQAEVGVGGGGVVGGHLEGDDLLELGGIAVNCEG